MTEKDEAKQLDSVTDRILETDAMEEDKAKNAMAALNNSHDNSETQQLSAISVEQADIDVIVEELEVTDDMAKRALQEVIFEGLVADGKTALEVALRRLVTGA